MFSHHDSNILYPSKETVSKTATHLTQARQTAIAVALLKTTGFDGKFCIVGPLAHVKVDTEENTKGPTDLHLLKLSCQLGSITASKATLPFPWQKLFSSDADPSPLTLSPTSCFSLWTPSAGCFLLTPRTEEHFSLEGGRVPSAIHHWIACIQASATASNMTQILQSLPLKEFQCFSTNTFFWR